MSASVELVKLVLKPMAEKASLKVIEHLSSLDDDVIKGVKKSLPENFKAHLILLDNWSANLPFIGLSIPKNVESTTIELSIANQISRFDSSKKVIKVNENDLLKNNGNVLLSGAPGAGKTTTLKRIISKYFRYHESFDYDFPILIRLRNLDFFSTVSTSILDIMNIKYISKTVKKKIEKLNDDGENIILEIEETSYYVGNEKVSSFIPKLLESTTPLIILDGLDEVHNENKNTIRKEIEEIGLSLSNAKIILTTRKSKNLSSLTNFHQYEIRPLEKKQVILIADKWLGVGMGNEFYISLTKRPYADLANRPVFLTLLMLLWNKNQKYLPLQPYEVYKEATYLILRDWDEHRGIYRKSKYAGFNTRKKLEFLFELAYYLSYEVKETVFTSLTLKTIFSKIHKKYKLPIEEVEEIIAELEDHNGIIVESQYKCFEFSHLSIQEYLSAEYLVRVPCSMKTLENFCDKPEPFAIAICISGDSGIWLANLLLNPKHGLDNPRFLREEGKYFDPIFILISRLTIESPTFNVSKELGAVILFFLFNFTNIKLEMDNNLIRILNIPNVKESLNLILESYKCRLNPSIKPNYISLKRDSIVKGDYFVKVPVAGAIALVWFEKYVEVDYRIEESKLIII